MVLKNLRRIQIAPYKLIVVIALAIASSSVFQAIRLTLGWRVEHDAPLMLYIAQRILAGSIPYRDIFDMNLPGGYMLYVSGLLLFGESEFAFRLFDLFWMGLAGLSMIYFSRREGLLAGASSAIMFASYHLSLGNSNEGQRDFLMVPFLIMSASFVCNYLENGKNRSLVLSGLCAGMSCSVKPFVFSITLLYSILIIALNGPAKSLKPLLSLFAGIIVVPGLLALWLFYTGGLIPLIDIIKNYLIPLYGKVAQKPYSELFIELMQYIGLFVPLLLLPHALSAENRSRWWVLILSVLGAALHYFAQHKGWAYHVYPVAAFLSIAAGMKIAAVGTLRKGTGESLNLKIGSTLIVLLSFATFCFYVSLTPVQLEAANVAHVDALQNDMLPLLQPGDTVQVMDTSWGAVSALYRLRREMPTRFMYDFYLYQQTEEPYVQKMRDEFVAKLTASMPGLLVVTEWEFPVRTLGKFRTRLIPGLQELLDRDYMVAVDRRDYIIYRRK